MIKINNSDKDLEENTNLDSNLQFKITVILIIYINNNN